MRPGCLIVKLFDLQWKCFGVICYDVGRAGRIESKHLVRRKQQSRNETCDMKCYESFLIKAVWSQAGQLWRRTELSFFECWCISESFIHFQFKLGLSLPHQNHWYSNNLSGTEGLLYFACVEGWGFVCGFASVCMCALASHVISIQGRDRQIQSPQLLSSFICPACLCFVFMWLL